MFDFQRNEHILHCARKGDRMEVGKGKARLRAPPEEIKRNKSEGFCMETPILGKVAFITGAGYGVGCDPKAQGEHAPNMGAAIAQRLAKMGLWKSKNSRR